MLAAYPVYLARLAAGPVERRPGAGAERELVARPAAPRRPRRGAGLRPAGDVAAGDRAGAEPSAARKAGSIALSLTWLGTLLLVVVGRDARARGHASAVGQHVRVRRRGPLFCVLAYCLVARGATCAGSACSSSARSC